MKERPILFSGPMVRAILSGTKTQTRRLMQSQPYSNGMRYSQELGDIVCHNDFLPPSAMLMRVGRGPNSYVTSNLEDDWTQMSPYGVAGDRLWVRETFYCDDYRYPDAPHDELLEEIEYRATHDCRNWEAGCPCRDDQGRSSWRPSIHMPRWASRLTLEITDVRVERLKDITEADALAEGVDPYECVSGPATPDARAAFAELWDRVNGKRAPWASNPWVWALSFKRVVESRESEVA